MDGFFGLSASLAAAHSCAYAQHDRNSISADATSDATLTVQIDLGQSGLMTPESYWDAVSNPESALKSGALYRGSEIA